jgi:serine/threonine-protein kinase RsbW
VGTHTKAIMHGDHLLVDTTIADAKPAINAERPIETAFQIPSQSEFIAPAVDRIIRRIRKARCIPGKEDDVQGALFEALANAVTHGNHQDARKPVRIRCRFEPRRCLSIIVTDEGAGFDPAKIPDPTRPENLGSDHGRGVFLMRTFMDEVRFEKGGTEVHLVKNCDGPIQHAMKGAAARVSDFVHSKMRRRKH